MSRNKPMSQAKKKRIVKIFSIVLAGLLVLLMALSPIVYFFI